MKITQFLRPESVLADLAGGDVRSVLAELCAPIANVTHRPADDLFKVLLEREQLGSTGVGDGVAFPHGKLAGLPGVVASFGRSRNGVDFRPPDGKPVRLFVALLAPTEAAAAHLNALARLARVFKNAALRGALLKSGGAQEIYRLLTEADAGP